MFRKLALLPLLAAGALAQQVETPSSDPRPGSALISVDRKAAPPEKTGIWLRHVDGRLERVWEGEPYDVRLLRDGRVLVAERWKGRVLLLDQDKQVAFEKKGLVEPVDVEMAKDGTIVVLLRTAGEVIGLHPESGKQVWKRSGFTTPFDVEVLPDGGLVVADSGANRLVELDAEGNVRRTIGGIDFPNTVERLQDGGLLVTNWGGGDVFELDPQGKVRWTFHLGGTLYRAARRPDGRTELATAEGQIAVIDAGRIVGSAKVEQLVDYEPIDQP